MPECRSRVARRRLARRISSAETLANASTGSSRESQGQPRDVRVLQVHEQGAVLAAQREQGSPQQLGAGEVHERREERRRARGEIRRRGPLPPRRRRRARRGGPRDRRAPRRRARSRAIPARTRTTPLDRGPRTPRSARDRRAPTPRASARGLRPARRRACCGRPRARPSRGRNPGGSPGGSSSPRSPRGPSAGRAAPWPSNGSGWADRPPRTAARRRAREPGPCRRVGDQAELAPVREREEPAGAPFPTDLRVDAHLASGQQLALGSRPGPTVPRRASRERQQRVRAPPARLQPSRSRRSSGRGGRRRPLAQRRRGERRMQPLAQPTHGPPRVAARRCSSTETSAEAPWASSGGQPALGGERRSDGRRAQVEQEGDEQQRRRRRQRPTRSAGDRATENAAATASRPKAPSIRRRDGIGSARHRHGGRDPCRAAGRASRSRAPPRRSAGRGGPSRAPRQRLTSSGVTKSRPREQPRRRAPSRCSASAPRGLTPISTRGESRTAAARLATYSSSSGATCTRRDARAQGQRPRRG